ncbi:MAG: peptide chain release factor N(5)-glutamine methyltransferase [Deltaproteobacteria bacterium]|nr:peptide chain release factor N(5)-glutamine methyltransferase [Deltaproteobacteria bacterium]
MRTLQTVTDAVSWAEECIKKSGLGEAGKEALFMVARLIDARPPALHALSLRRLDASELKLLKEWIERRIRREPLQYILGETEFWGLNFKVGPKVLIPRPETEHLVSEGIKVLKDRQNPLILDLSTGSGCIAVALAKELPQARVVATDISADALAWASENAGINGVAGRIRFLEGNLFEALDSIGSMRGFLPTLFDLIISNPPYVKSSEVFGLEPEVALHEPLLALDGGEDGLYFIRRVIGEAPQHLKPAGVLIVEMGYGQSEDIRRIMAASKGFGRFEIKKDYSAIERVLSAEKKEREGDSFE